MAMSGIDVDDTGSSNYQFTTTATIPAPNCSHGRDEMVCKDFLENHRCDQYNPYLFDDLPGKRYIQLVLACLILIINLVVIVALIKSWKKFRQNMYIFALSTGICDAILGLVNFINSIHHIVAQTASESSSEGVVETEWYYNIRASAFLATEISSAGHTALITVAFSRYVYAQMPKYQTDLHQYRRERFATGLPNTKEQFSILFSRRRSWFFSSIVWVISVTIFLVGMFLNCTDVCSCFLENGSLVRSQGSALCLYHYHCSFLFLPMKDAYAISCGVFFIIAVGVIVFFGFKTTYASGGLASLLPYRCHLLLVRKGKEVQKENLRKRSTRKSSMQLSYSRHMTHFIFFVMLNYLVCRLPANILIIIDSLTTTPFIPVLVADISSILAFAHSLFNPIVYFFTLDKLKQAVFDLFDSCCFKTVETRRGLSTHDSKSGSSKEKEKPADPSSSTLV